jgi:hypothetical protein
MYNNSNNRKNKFVNKFCESRCTYRLPLTRFAVAIRSRDSWGIQFVDPNADSRGWITTPCVCIYVYDRVSMTLGYSQSNDLQVHGIGNLARNFSVAIEAFQYRTMRSVLIDFLSSFPDSYSRNFSHINYFLSFFPLFFPFSLPLFSQSFSFSFGFLRFHYYFLLHNLNALFALCALMDLTAQFNVVNCSMNVDARQ